MRFKKSIICILTAVLLLAGLAFAGSLSPPPPPTTTFTFYNDNDFPVKIRASVYLEYQKQNWDNASRPGKFLDVEADVAPYGSYTRTEVYDRFYKGFGASGSVWFEGRTLRQDCSCPGVKSVTVRALRPFNVSTSCTGGN